MMKSTVVVSTRQYQCHCQCHSLN